MVKTFLADVQAWAQDSPDIQALLLVGSCARGTNRPDSDVDLMVLTPKQMEYVACHAFASRFGEVEREETEDWGACQSVRVFYRGGLEVEFGFVLPCWLDVPLDPGTRDVLRAGYRFLTDKKAYASFIEKAL